MTYNVSSGTLSLYTTTTEDRGRITESIRILVPVDRIRQNETPILKRKETF